MKNMIVVAGLLAVTASLTMAQAADRFTTLRVSTPLLVSGSVGLRLGDGADGSLRPAMQVEAGVGGGRIATGLDNTGESGIGYGLKAAILRTWLEPLDVDEDQTFMGLEAELSIKKLILNLGGYRRISAGDDDWIGSAGLGFVF